MQDEKQNHEMELVALSLLDRAAEPVGSPRLVSAFRAEGIDVAEATAGRFLRVMDERGLTERRGRQGRLITARPGAAAALAHGRPARSWCAF